MRYLSVLCTVLSLAGCALISPEAPSPVNGRCSTTQQDRCLFGTPTGTGDRSAPYEWTCAGSYGGVNDSCYLPTARVDGSVFAGQPALAQKVKAAGPLRGLLTLADNTLGNPECTVSYDCHVFVMERYIREQGIPKENINLSSASHLSQIDPAMLGDTLVVAVPSYIAVSPSFEDIDILQRSDLLVVASAGNTSQVEGRALWYPDHPWLANGGWERSMAFLGIGKVLLAKYVMRNSDGTAAHYEGNVKCRLAMDHCYSIFRPAHQNPGTSGAAANLGALTFYLFQLWDTPEEVVGVINLCAEDVGEPGVDEEFGRGIVSVVCDTVHNRERTVVADSVTVFGGFAGDGAHE